MIAQARGRGRAWALHMYPLEYFATSCSPSSHQRAKASSAVPTEKAVRAAFAAAAPAGAQNRDQRHGRKAAAAQ